MIKAGLIALLGVGLMNSVRADDLGSRPRVQKLPRTVMVQMFEWPWQDLATECEQVLGPMGIAAVQVSPPQEHLSLGKNFWWERYQPVTFDLVSRSGTELQFREMISRCKNVGVDVYADVILNHMAGIAEGRGFNGTRYTKYNYADLFSPADFHFCGRYGDNQIRNYKDRFELQFCELLGLADLNTESLSVQKKLVGYLNKLLDAGVAGFRLDTAKHIDAKDLEHIVQQIKRSAYMVAETLVGPGDPVTVEEYTPFSDVNYFPYGYDLANSLRGRYFAYWAQSMNGYPRSDLAVVFVENHDTQRELPQKSLSSERESELFNLAEVFMLTWPYGYPQVFSGYRFTNYDEGPPVDAQGFALPVLAGGRCQAPWDCHHRKPEMWELVRFRNQTDGTFAATHISNLDGDFLAFSRGPLGFVAINAKDVPLNLQIPTGLPDGEYCELLTRAREGQSSCSVVVPVRQGLVTVSIQPRSAKVLLSSERQQR